MRKKTKLLIAVVAGILVALLVLLAFIHKQPSDKCSAIDRQQNNCVPAGRCTPPGDPREATTDCALKTYDHKFNSSK